MLKSITIPIQERRLEMWLGLAELLRPDGKTNQIPCPRSPHGEGFTAGQLLPAFLLDLLFVPKMKRVGEDDVAEQIMPGSVVNVEGGIHLEIAGDVASKADGG